MHQDREQGVAGLGVCGGRLRVDRGRTRACAIDEGVQEVDMMLLLRTRPCALITKAWCQHAAAKSV
jgi:hypothetical protein